MPPLTLLAPIALPLVAGGLTAALGLAGLKPGRAIVGAGAWGALLLLFLLWLPVRSTEELTLGPLGFGAGFDLRLDGVAFSFGVVVLGPADPASRRHGGRDTLSAGLLPVGPCLRDGRRELPAADPRRLAGLPRGARFIGRCGARAGRRYPPRVSRRGDPRTGGIRPDGHRHRHACRAGGGLCPAGVHRHAGGVPAPASRRARPADPDDDRGGSRSAAGPCLRSVGGCVRSHVRGR